MAANDTQREIEKYLGQVPSWIENLAQPTRDHSWGMVRDLEFGETDLTPREKALIGVGASAAMQCPYCVHFHKAEARLEDVTEEELAETVNIASSTRYFSTVLHGAEVELDDFVEETTEIVEHIEEQEAAAGAD